MLKLAVLPVLEVPGEGQAGQTGQQVPSGRESGAPSGAVKALIWDLDQSSSRDQVERLGTLAASKVHQNALKCLVVKPVWSSDCAYHCSRRRLLSWSGWNRQQGADNMLQQLLSF